MLLYLCQHTIHTYSMVSNCLERDPSGSIDRVNVNKWHLSFSCFITVFGPVTFYNPKSNLLNQWRYTQSQKKCTINSLASSGTQGQGHVTRVGSYFIIQHKFYLSTLLGKRNATFYGEFLLRLSVVAWIPKYKCLSKRILWPPYMTHFKDITMTLKTRFCREKACKISHNCYYLLQLLLLNQTCLILILHSGSHTRKHYTLLTCIYYSCLLWVTWAKASLSMLGLPPI